MRKKISIELQFVMRKRSAGEKSILPCSMQDCHTNSACHIALYREGKVFTNDGGAYLCDTHADDMIKALRQFAFKAPLTSLGTLRFIRKPMNGEDHSCTGCIIADPAWEILFDHKDDDHSPKRIFTLCGPCVNRLRQSCAPLGMTTVDDLEEL